MSRASSVGGFVLLAGLAAATAGHPQGVATERIQPDTGTDPGSQVTQWIKIARWSAPGQGLPIIDIAPVRFALRPGGRETLILLPERQYQALLTFTRAQPCTPMPVRSAAREFDGGAIVESRDGGNPLPCAMPHVTACAFLHSISALPGVRWTATDLEPVLQLALEMKCAGP